MEKKISYMSRDFEAIRDELLKLTKEYYPEIFDDIDDSAVGSFFLDLVAAVGDDLSYHTDRMFQETNMDSAKLRNTLMSMARTAGLKVPGNKASSCEVEISLNVPPSPTNIAAPNYSYAPIIQKNSVVSSGNYTFELSENLNFREQFNSDGYSNRKIVPIRDANGSISGYTLTKSCIVTNGTTKVYKKVISYNDLKPFMEIVLPESNVMNVESIIFKETSDFNANPSIYEYYIDEEEFKISSQSVMTYRFFECDSLVDMYRFGANTEFIDGTNDKVISNIYNPSIYYDSKNNVAGVNSDEKMFYVRGKWKPLRQKFITEFTDNGFLKIIFGAGNTYHQNPVCGTEYGQYIASNIINNDMLGVLPKEGWTMFVLYKTGGGISSNLGLGAINKITLANIDWGQADGTNGSIKGDVVKSLKVTNISTALAGKDAPSTEELKYLIKYNTSAQNRAVTVKDYKVKLMQMPPKFGAPFRCSVIESNNKIEIDMLSLDDKGKLDKMIPNTLATNAVNWIRHYRQINDYVEFMSGLVYNIGVAVDMYVDKNYEVEVVINNTIEAIKSYFDVSKHDIGDDIFVGDLIKSISQLDGVVNVTSIKIYKLTGRGSQAGEKSYSTDECPLPTVIEGSSCNNTTGRFIFSGMGGVIGEEIDLDAVENTLYNDYNAMYEIKYPEADIQVRCKTV